MAAYNEALDQVRLNFSADSLLALNLTLAFIMFGVALGIKTEHFKKILINPKSAIIGFVSQFLLLPVITFIVCILFQNKIVPSIAMGMLLVASCPGGNVSNFMSSLAKANTALSVSLTGIATLGAIILTPLNFAFWAGLYNKIYESDASHLIIDIDIDIIDMFKTVFILLGIPLVIGMFVSAKFPKLTSKIIKPISTFSFIAFIGIVILAFTKNYDHFANYISTVFIIVLVHNALAFLTGYAFASAFKLSKPDRKTITIETGIQNSGLGLVLIFNQIFTHDGNLALGGMALVTAWWGIWHIISGLTLSSIWSKKS